ncbi:MAG: FxLYD domain-containing protein [Ardenticatenaceae bacterium]|nr:FxLYD domain-containing protein [Ardenticatenaceae bacterium]
MKLRWRAHAQGHGLATWGLFGAVMALALLAGCRTNPTTPPAATIVKPVVMATATAQATMPPTATSAPPTLTPIPPTSTPDLTRLPEQYEHPQSLFRLHYPAGWTVEDLSSDNEVLVSFKAPGEADPAIFVVDLVNPGGQLTDTQMPTLVESYLDNFFQSQANAVTLEHDTLPDGTIRVVARGQGESSGEQLHLEFRFASRAPLFQTLILISSEAGWAETQPLLSSMADSLQLDLPKASIVPAASAASDKAVAEGLMLINSSHFTASTGSLYLVGEVQNTGEQTYQEVEVTVHLLDSSGTDLSTKTWGTKTSLLRPGETSPVVVIFEKPPAGWTEMRTEVTATPADFYLKYVYPDLTISQDTGGVPTFGDYRITGTVTNSGAETAHFMEIIGTLYDKAGKVLAVESMFLQQEVLEPGQSAPFELVFFGKAEGDVARHQIVAQGARANNK